jgi:hypothetical protein
LLAIGDLSFIPRKLLSFLLSFELDPVLMLIFASPLLSLPNPPEIWDNQDTQEAQEAQEFFDLELLV